MNFLMEKRRKKRGPSQKKFRDTTISGIRIKGFAHNVIGKIVYVPSS